MPYCIFLGPFKCVELELPCCVLCFSNVLVVMFIISNNVFEKHTKQTRI